jgi:hypothetical protein
VIIEHVNADLKNSTLAHLPSGKFTATPPGSCSRSWPSTSPVPPRPSPAGGYAERPHPPSAEPSSPSQPGSRPQPDEYTCTYRQPGHGATHGPNCSTTPTDHPRPLSLDHRQPRHDRTPQNPIQVGPSHTPRQPRPATAQHAPASPQPVGGSRLKQPLTRLMTNALSLPTPPRPFAFGHFMRTTMSCGRGRYRCYRAAALPLRQR